MSFNAIREIKILTKISEFTVTQHSNVLAIVQCLIGSLEICNSTSAIYCCKLFDIVNYVPLLWITWASTLQFDTKQRI